MTFNKAIHIKDSWAVTWTPASLGSGLIAWYKADTQVYHTGTTAALDTETISGWQDQSGNGNHLIVGLGINQPTFAATGLNGKPAVRFGAQIQEEMRTGAFNPASDTVVFGTGNKMSSFCLAGLNNTANSGGVVAFGHAAGPGPSSDTHGMSILGVFTAGPSPIGIGITHANDQQALSTITTTAAARYGGIYNGDDPSGTTYINNVAGTPFAFPSFSFTTPGIIYVGSSGGSLVGYFSEIIITNTVIASSDLTALDAYLVSRA